MAALLLRRFCGFSFNFYGNICQLQRRKCSIMKLSVKDVFRTAPIGEKVRVLGWVKGLRKQKQNTFLDIGDGLCGSTLQVVSKSNDLSGHVNYGCSVEVVGELIKSNHPAQPFELQSESVQVIGVCNLKEYPLHPRDIQPADFTRDFLHLRPRTDTFSSLLRARSSFYFEIHNYFQKQDFIHIDTPVLTTNDCEGTGDVFFVKAPVKSTLQKSSETSSDKSQTHFFDEDVFLTGSSQFHLETMACALTNVYTIGPTFRAENSRSRHHLSEFHMLEAEMVVPALCPLTNFMEDLIKSVTREVLNKCHKEVSLLHTQAKYKVDLERCLNNPFKMMTYTEAIKILEKATGLEPVKWGQDINKQHEQHLVRHCDNIPVFITKFPTKLKPFYMKISDDDNDTVEAVDLLVPDAGELCGGSVREHRLDELSDRIQNSNVKDSLQWYLDLRKYGTVPHAGFGMGVERYLQWILGVNSIKDTIAFPRWPHHCQQ